MKWKPCPFCGADMYLVDPNIVMLSWVECRMCGARGPIARSERDENTTKLWNKRHVPDEIKILRERLNTQDNRVTAHPLYCVQQRRRISGMDPQYGGDDYEWVYVDDPEYRYAPDDFKRALVEDFEVTATEAAEVDLLDHMDTEVTIGGNRFERVYHLNTWEFITAHFTEAAAEEYIQENKHNLTDPRVYVSSQSRCHEWNAVVEMLKKKS